jgi:hypothetical protein
MFCSVENSCYQFCAREVAICWRGNDFQEQNFDDSIPFYDYHEI